MRQPEILPVLAPSKIPLWYGWAAEGDRFTFSQRQTMEADGIDPETVDVIHCRRAANDREVYVSFGQMPPIYEFDCPIIGWGRTGKVKVISPSGLSAFVRSDGWVGSPAKPRERGWMW